jgi:L-ascorbate metabolism protein UlaG (beta-lactamase superfamily)
MGQQAASAESLLSLKPQPASAVVWHLSHSGFAVRTAARLLIFDYTPGKVSRSGAIGGLMAGEIDPKEIANQDVVVFVSHEHGDHFYPECFQWKETVDHIRFVVSSGVAKKDGRFSEQKELTTVMDPGQTKEIDGLVVKTVPSTDLGVGFLVRTDGLSIWHAGDTAAWGGKVSGFLDNLSTIRGEPIDIAFQVGEAGFWDFADAMKPKLIVPMHFFGRYKMADQLQSERAKRRSTVPYWKLEKPGDWILFKDGKMIRPQDIGG